MSEIIKRESDIKINENAINEVTEKMMKKFDIPEDKAKSMLGIGIVNAVMMNRYRENDRI